MSNLVIQCDLVEELTTEQQEVLAGGQDYGYSSSQYPNYYFYGYAYPYYGGY
ncbi:hypothetical protein H6G93_14030 [Nostoc sp. FACHB-973]|nr:hypothetical protein [Nostoc sp. FACHB-973]